MVSATPNTLASNLLDMTQQESRDARVLSVNVGAPQVWAKGKHNTGIEKLPRDVITVKDPGPRETGGRSGVADDFVGDLKHHGGSDKAVYLFAHEELEWWAQELGRGFSAGAFGENITTLGIDLDALVVGTTLRIDEVELEVSLPRIPCRTFAWWMQEQGWVKTFTERGRSGAYTRVLRHGAIRPGASIVVGQVPDHGITVAQLFRARLGDRMLLERVVDARILSVPYQADYEKYLGRPAKPLSVAQTE